MVANDETIKLQGQALIDQLQPGLQAWFKELGPPSPPQRLGWPAIRSGKHCLIAAPTGTGKTLAAFTQAIDSLLAQHDQLEPGCQVLYISPLKALANDIEKNLQQPLRGVCHLDVTAPQIQVAVRSGDTPAAERSRMAKKPPHILVTTPESLAILLTSRSGRAALSTVKTVIVDEIHALAGDKRGSHLALSLERLEHLVLSQGGQSPQRIGLSATQKPLTEIASFLVGRSRQCEIVDVGHLRVLDLDLLTPASPLSAICSAECWNEIFEIMAEQIRSARCTLIFVTTRKLAERVAAGLRDLLTDEDIDGSPHDAVKDEIRGRITCHHGSLSKERRLAAEQALKNGELQALVATASLELGIDIGDVDLVLQLGSPRAIATFLQRAGRAGHAIDRRPVARLLPLTTHELEEHAALLRAIKAGQLDRIIQPIAPLDILAQHIVSHCVEQEHEIDALYHGCREAWPYRHLDRNDFDALITLHCQGRWALLRREGNLIQATKRARLIAMTSSGAIPDTADFTVKDVEDDSVIGSLDEDFSLESNPGDIFQLGTTSWLVQRVDSRAGIVWVRNVGDAPPSLPFWFGEAPARTRELSEAVGDMRIDCPEDEDGALAWFRDEVGLNRHAAEQLYRYYADSRAVLGLLPSHRHVVAERFFDETGGMQFIVHAPLGARLMRAWAIGLRKKFCRGFGFELEAAANEEAFILSLAPNTSFPVDEAFDYLSPNQARATLEQACITGGQFETRWRWNVSRALLVPRSQGGKRVPPHLLRLRAGDALAAAFPQVLACPENLAPGAMTIPREHPIVAQTLRDCLEELLDAEGLEEVLFALRDGDIQRSAVDVAQHSPLAGSILNAQPYAFLDDVPAEERRVRAVSPGQGSSAQTDRFPDNIAGELEPGLFAEARSEFWPSANTADELAEILAWCPFLRHSEVVDSSWLNFADQLIAAGRAHWRDNTLQSAAHETDKNDTVVKADPEQALKDKAQSLGARLEALGAITKGELQADELPAALALEQSGLVIEVLSAGEAWYGLRPLIQRVHRRMAENRRARVQAVTPLSAWRAIAAWQGLYGSRPLPASCPSPAFEGPRGLATVLSQLRGVECPAGDWLSTILPARVQGFRPEWLDEVLLDGEFSWARLWRSRSGGNAREAGGRLRRCSISFFPRAQGLPWRQLAELARLKQSSNDDEPALGGVARDIITLIDEQGDCFHRDLRTIAQMDEHLEGGLAELIQAGLLSSDSFAAMRYLMLSAERRRRARPPRGRWALLRPLVTSVDPSDEQLNESLAESLAHAALARTGVVCRALYRREHWPLPWYHILRALRRLELRGDCLTGRFISGLSGEQFALPAFLPTLKAGAKLPELSIAPCDPLNYSGVLDGERRLSSQSKEQIIIAAGNES